MTDYRFVETVFRIVRTEFKVSLNLSVAQFLNSGNFALKKIQFISEVVRAVVSKLGPVIKERRSGSCPQVSVIEEEVQAAPTPLVFTESRSPCPVDMSEETIRIGEMVEKIGLKIDVMEEKIFSCFEAVCVV